MRHIVSFRSYFVYNSPVTGLLLQTKLFKPAPRPSLIARTHLFQRLNEGLGHGADGFAARLTLVSAPAGFGKTTLVSSWLAQLATYNAQIASQNTAWLSLDENDNDPVRFLTYLTAALQMVVADSGETALRALQSPQAPATEAVLTLLINKISQNGLPVILVLDDYHLITNPSIHQAVSFLLDHLPPLLHLLIITRSDPPLPLSHLRADGDLVEIRAADLRFSLHETTLFLNQLRNLDLSEESVAALAQRTEGWVAGLHLAALSLQHREDKAGFVASFTGNSRFIMDYLVDEVLQQRPAGTGQFLLQTAILDPLCASLCDAVTGRKDSQAILERLEEANLFVVPLDDARVWYRYHHLFADVLQARLRQTQPDQIPNLHRHAANWHVGQGMTDEAIRYALSFGNFDEAARLIESVATGMLHRGASVSLMRWLDAMPDEMIRARPRLCLARGWAFNWGPGLSPQSAEEWAQLAMDVALAGQSMSSELSGEIAALQATIAATRNEMARSRELSLQALDDLSIDSPWRSVVALCLGTAHLDFGDMAAASQAFGEAIALGQARGVHFIQLAAASFLADIDVYHGHLSSAMEMYRQVLAWTDHGLPQKGSIMAHGGQAGILYERNQLDAALTQVRLGLAQLEKAGSAYSAFVLNRVLVRVQQAQGNWTDALDTLDRAYRMGQSTEVSLVVTQASALRAHLQLSQGDLEAAQEWAANSGLSPDDAAADHPGWREVEYLSLARVLYVEGRHAQTLSLLDRLLQSAQTEARQGSAIPILVLQAVVHQAQDNERSALECLERALVLAEPEGYCRVFIDEGRPMADLLRLARLQGICPEYVGRLLDAFDAEESRQHDAGLRPEPLSERELEVLRLAAAGATNKQIAGELFIAVPTVKKHMGHILVKLDTHNRVRAVARARELGLL